MIRLKNVSYTVKGQRLLEDVWLTSHCGECHAIMGGSGSGKSTLLSVMLGRVSGRVDGDVDAPPGKFVPQEPVLRATSTPREILSFACALSGDDKVELFLKRFGLEKQADVKVGNETMKGLSGGQKKRLSIAVELVTVPRALALDEPTSGLDSRSSLEVMQIVYGLARDGCNIITAIHAPSAAIFNTLSRVTLLHHGKIAYSGPDLQTYLATVAPPKENITAAEHALNVLTDFGDVLTEKWAPQAEDAATSSVPVRINDELLEEGDLLPPTSSWSVVKLDIEDPAEAPQQQPKILRAIRLLYWDTIKSTIRNPRDGRLRLKSNLIVAILTALCFTGFRNSQRWVTPRRSLLFMALVFQFLNAVAHTSTLFAVERTWLLHEYHNNRFPYAAYFVARLATYCTTQTVYTILYATIVYFMTNFGAVAKFWTFLIVLILHALTSGLIGLLIGSIAKSPQHCNALLAPFLVPNFLFSGFLFSRSQCPVYLLPFWYGNFFRYSIEALTYLEFHDGTFRSCGLDKSVQGKCPFGVGRVHPSVATSRRLHFHFLTVCVDLLDVVIIPTRDKKFLLFF